jgi:hypothetical protein
MRRENRYVASLFLSAALMSPIALHAIVTPQDDHEKHEQEEQNRKVMDEQTHQYRAWDKVEDDTYRHWLEGKHRTYVDYEKLDAKTKREYWKWRHEHEDQAH